MIAILLMVGIVFTIFINTFIGGAMLLLAVWGSIIRFLAIGANKGGAQRKKD